MTLRKDATFVPAGRRNWGVKSVEIPECGGPQARAPTLPAQRFRRHGHGAGEPARRRARSGPGTLFGYLAGRAAGRPGRRAQGFRAPVHRPDAGLPRRRHRLSRPAALAGRGAGDDPADGGLRTRAPGRSAHRRRTGTDGHHHRALPRCRLHPRGERVGGRERRRFYAQPRHAQRQVPEQVPARGGDVRLGADRDPPRALHRLRGSARPFARRRSARPPGRATARHRRHARADGGSLLPRKMPRPAVRRVRAGRRRRALGRGRAQGAIRFRPRPACARHRGSSPPPSRIASESPSNTPIGTSSRYTAATIRT